MSIKQDGTRVRTAHDLERKYKLAQMSRAFEQSEKSLTKVNQILQDFVNTIVCRLDSNEGLSDGYIATYYHNGAPSLEGFPTAEWTDGYGNHINDYYYDKDTGKAYKFVVKDEVYSWDEITDEDQIQVLAMANATIDTKDNVRRVFLETPTPPYSNGDLWLKDGVIFACQISKGAEEEYESLDFILASDYNVNTLAIQTGNQLEILKGTVLKIIEDANKMQVMIDNLDNEEFATIELVKDMLKTLIVDADGSSMMTQTEDGFRFEMSSITQQLEDTSDKVGKLEEETGNNSETLGNVEKLVAKLEERTAYVDVKYTEDGKPMIELGSGESEFQVIITNTHILFKEGTLTPASISNETMHIKNANVENLLQIGSVAWVKRANGHISLMPKGV